MTINKSVSRATIENTILKIIDQDDVTILIEIDNKFIVEQLACDEVLAYIECDNRRAADAFFFAHSISNYVNLCEQDEIDNKAFKCAADVLQIVSVNDEIECALYSEIALDDLIAK